MIEVHAEPGVAEVVPLPDGETVALLAVDSETPDGKRRKDERDVAEVYGEQWYAYSLRRLQENPAMATTIARAAVGRALRL